MLSEIFLPADVDQAEDDLLVALALADANVAHHGIRFSVGERWQDGEDVFHMCCNVLAHILDSIIIISITHQSFQSRLPRLQRLLMVSNSSKTLQKGDKITAARKGVRASRHMHFSPMDSIPGLRRPRGSFRLQGFRAKKGSARYRKSPRATRSKQEPPRQNHDQGNPGGHSSWPKR